MKATISLPDPLFEKADLLARRQGKSRSRLYRDAVAEYVARHEPEALTRAIDEVIASLEPAPAPFVKRAGELGFQRIEWED